METADKVKEFIYKNDKLFTFLEAKPLLCKPGEAVVKMTVKDKHMNAAGVCHGGVIFTLADLAFALASNATGELALAVEASITYTKAANLGDELVAHAKEITKTRKLGFYQIEVKNTKTQELIAFFKGTVYIVGKNFLNT